MEFFIVEHGVMWDSILEVLEQKVKEGVEVRFMYDGMGCLKPASLTDIRRCSSKRASPPGMYLARDARPVHLSE